MRKELFEIRDLIDDARRAERRMNHKESLRLISEARNLISSMLPPVRCQICGMKHSFKKKET